jgi:osmotically-inducible protein OsmY
MLGGWACWATSLSAGEVGAPAIGTVNTIVVTAKKTPEPVADEEVKKQVETAVHSDPYFYDEQVTVTVKDGVVHLQGVVFDDWDLRTARRVSKKIRDVKRIVNELQICSCDGGGGA